MREYETVFILEPTLDETAVAQEVEKVTNLIRDLNGEVISTEPSTKRKLAYEIKGNREGYFTLIRFKCDPKSIGEIDRIYKLNERVLRYIIVVCPEKKAVAGAEPSAGD